MFLKCYKALESHLMCFEYDTNSNSWHMLLEISLSLISKAVGDNRCSIQIFQDGDCWKYFFWTFDAQFGYIVFEGIFTLDNYINWDYRLHG